MPRGHYERKPKKRKYSARRVKRGVATAVDILHESNFKAERDLEIVIGSDRIVRINIDGVCALRVRCTSETTIRVDQMHNKLAEIIG